MSVSLSIIIVVFNMPREAPRTVASFLRPYQTCTEDIEIIVVDNGSVEPLPADAIPPGVRYLYLEEALPSPAHAVNRGAAEASGEFIGIVIDGARMASPGLVKAGLDACRKFPNPVVGSVAFHLGHEPQQVSTLKGYNAAIEDNLLESISWPADGYRLFEISCLAASNLEGWFSSFNESNCLFLRRDLFQVLGGMNERFELAGGGLVNLEFFSRAVLAIKTDFVMLLGEGTFHQVHGGSVSNPGIKLELRRYSSSEMAADYERVTGRPYTRPNRTPILFGIPHPASFRHLGEGAMRALAKADKRPSNLASPGVFGPEHSTYAKSAAWRLTKPLRWLGEKLRN